MKFLRKLFGFEDDKIIGLCAFNKKFAQNRKYSFPRFDAQCAIYNTNLKNNFLL